MKKIFKKTARAIIKKGKKRYIKKSGGLKLGKIYKDVMSLKKMVNAEKKHITTDIENAAVGQVNVNVSGHYLVDVSPKPIQGVAYNERTGQSIKQVSSYYVYQFTRQTGLNALPEMKLKIEFIYVVGQPYGTASNALPVYIKHNPFVDSANIYDFHCERKPEYYKDFRVLARRIITFRENDQSGQYSIKTVKIPIRMPPNFHIKWSGNSATTQSTGQVLMLITADQGNIGGANTTLDDMPYTQSNTGINFDWYATHYYYDN